MYKKTEYHKIKTRLEEERRFIQVVMGARQIGKSTVVKQVLNDISIPFLFYSVDNVPATNSSWISNCWARITNFTLYQYHFWQLSQFLGDFGL